MLNAARALFAILLLASVASAAEPSPEPSSEIPPAEERTGVHWGGIPIGNYTTDLGLQVGVLAQRFDYGSGAKPFENLETFFFQYGTLGPREAGLQYEVTGLGSADLRLFTDVLLSYDPYQRYYGVGPYSFRNPALEAGGYNYDLQSVVELDSSLRKHVAENLDLYAGITVISNRSESEMTDSQYERDFGPTSDTIRYAKFLLGFVLERRDSEFYATRGDYAAATLSLAPAALSDAQSDWLRVDMEYRRYDSIVGNRWLYFATQFRYAGATSGAPLAEKPRLGSLGTLRGYPFNRYIDNHSVTLRTELRSLVLRWNIFGLPFKGGGGLFAELGRVGDTLSELGSTPTRPSGGFTLFGSYFTDDFIGAADLGFSQDGTNFYLHLDHAF